MEKQTVNGISPNMNGNSKRLPSYSVETPYGFHLDLDFLKYVDDIEKGNTLRRVPVQRRNRPSSASALVHNRSLPGYGRLHGPTQWSSIGSLWPKSRTIDACARHPSTPYRSLTNAQLEEERAFDEQPLGLYVRPNLLRTSSLPATVLQRKHSESNDDPTSPSGSRDHLLPENGSSDDVFSDSNRAAVGGTTTSGMLQRLTGALQRVGELEEEIRVIPELKAQICILQEERERLLMRLHSCPQNNHEAMQPASTANGQLQASTGGLADWGNGHSSGGGSNTLEDQEEDWMSRELKRLEEKVKASSVQVETEVLMSSARGARSGLGQRTDHQPVEVLQKRLANLEQRLKESETELQTAKMMLQNQVTESRLKDKRIEELTNNTDIWVKMESSEQKQGLTRNRDVSESTPKEWRVAEESVGRQEAKEPVDVSHHVGRVRKLLQEQWECLSGGQISEGVPADHLPHRASFIQKELMRLVDTLASYVAPGQKSGIEGKLFADTSVLREGDGVKDEAINSVGTSHRVDEAFIAACLYLKDHMDEMANLNDDMRQALTVVFQQWFQVAAEEDSSTHMVALYLGRVREAAPSLLQFLVNLADDNGNTALHYSVSHSNFSIVQTLLNTGVCDVDVRNKAGYTSIMLASLTAASSPQDLEVVCQLLQRGDVNVQAGQAGQTALHLAARHGRRLIVPLLLAVGADANAQDRAGSTALMLACERDHCDIAAILLQQADCDLVLTDREGRSALSIALKASYTDLADLLQAHMAS